MVLGANSVLSVHYTNYLRKVFFSLKCRRNTAYCRKCPRNDILKCLICNLGVFLCFSVIPPENPNCPRPGVSTARGETTAASWNSLMDEATGGKLLIMSPLHILPRMERWSRPPVRLPQNRTTSISTLKRAVGGCHGGYTVKDLQDKEERSEVELRRMVVEKEERRHHDAEEMEEKHGDYSQGAGFPGSSREMIKQTNKQK